MNRSLLPRFLLRLALAILLPLGTVPASAVFKAAPERPNIIFILADDLGYGDLSMTGQTRFATPHIDSLGRNGITFTQMYAGSSVCAPTRSCLMTGQTTGHTPIRGNFEVRPEGQAPLPGGMPTLSRVLQEAGYVTGAFGKWGLGFPGSEGDPMNQGFDVFFGWNCQRMGHHYYPPHLWDNDERLTLEGNADGGRGVYAPALVQEKTLAFIEANRERPFFCFVPTIIPHAELAAPEEYIARFRGKFGPETPYVGVDDGPDFRNGPYQSAAEPLATFAAMVTYLDDQVGEIIAKVKALGLEEKTLIVFTSDNGPHTEGGHKPAFFKSSGPFRGTKRALYEGGIHVPFVAQWTGTIEPGRQSDLVSAFWDMLPTFAELGGAAQVPGIDGLSIVPTLFDQPGQQIHEYLYWEFHEEGGRQAVRMGPWKAVRQGVAADRNAPLELYNLDEDIAEANDLAAQHPERVARMAQIMSEARTDSELFSFQQSGYLQKKKE